MVSTRDGQRNNSGELLPALFIINLENKSIERVDEGVPQIQIDGWADNKLVYFISYEKYSRDDNTKIKGVNLADNSLTTYASGKSLSSHNLIGNTVLYTIFEDNSDRGIYKIDLTSGQKSKLNNKALYLNEITGLNSAVYQRNSDYFAYKTDSGLTALSQKPVDKNRSQFSQSTSGTPAWIEFRDGKSTLIVDGKTVSGNKLATYNLRWIGDEYIIFTSQDNGSTDYVVDVNAKKPKKITSSYQKLRYYGF